MSYSASGLGRYYLHATPFKNPHEKYSNTPGSFQGLERSSRSWEKMVGREWEVSVVLGQEAVGFLRYIRANRTTPLSGAARRTSINNTTDIYDLWLPWRCKAPSRDRSPCPYTQLNPNSTALLFSHFDMVSFKHMWTLHFKDLCRAERSSWELCGTSKPN